MFYAGGMMAGFGGGGCIGLVGWGGAQIIIPSLHALGAKGAQAAAVSLCSLSLSAVAGGVTYAREGKSDLLIAAAIGGPAIVGARVGVRLASALSTRASSAIFNGASVALIPMHFAVQHRRRGADAAPEREASGPTAAAFAGHAVYGAFQGVTSAIMGVGGLPLAMSYLTLACPELPHHLVQGTAMAAVVPGVLAAAASHAASGNVPARLLACVAVGSAAGAAAGAKGALVLSEETLRDLYMASLLLLGGRSLVGAGRDLRALLARRGAP